jgi:type I restriction enzyme S subunit
MNRRAEFSDYELSEGDVILSLDRPVVKGGLKVARVTQRDLPSLLLQRVGRFRLHGGVEADYLYSFLHTAGFINAITGHDQSLGVPHVSPSQVEDVAMPLPSVGVQRRVAASLRDRAAETEPLQTVVEDRLTKIDKLPAALLRKAFAGDL